jgi:hemerythrin-like domain-containing protein
VQPDVLKKSATIIRTFIENYHEKLEEEFIFPRMKKSGKLVPLVEVLEKQHKAGRKLTGTIEKLATQTSIKVESDRQKLIYALESFIRMYRPHESREDTILFPEFHKMMSEKEYDKLGEQFEDREHKLFGKEGFEGVVVQIENLEKAYDIHDLSKFTPAT